MKMKGNFVGAGFALSLLLGSIASANAATYQAETNNGMSGLQFETTNDVGGGQSAGWIDEGDWVQWNINVSQAGNFTLTTRSATTSSARVEVFIDGNYVAELGLANLNSWTTWQSFTSSVFPITAGAHTLRVRFATGGQNLNWVQLDQTSAVNQAEAFTVGLWRLASRLDRSTLGRNGSTSTFVGADYISQPQQQWRLINRGSNNYDVKLESTQTCLARVSGAPALASCNTADSTWALEMLRARSVDRPAIYRLKSPQNTCLIPPASPSAQPTIGSCTTTDGRWYLEAVGYNERSAASQYQVSGLLIVKPTTGVNDTAHGLSAQGTIAQSIVEASQTSFKTGVKTWLERITDGRVTWTGASVVANEPIRSLSYDAYSNTWYQNPITGQDMVWNFTLERFEAAPGGFNPANYQATNFLPAAVNLPNDVQRFVPRGVYDTVQVFFTGGTVPGGWGWGPGRSAQSNYTLWTTVNGGTTAANDWLSTTNSEPTEVFIHEMMHGYDAHYSQLGVQLPDGWLHGADTNRYGGNAGWVHWYRDYWLGTVIATDDTYRGYGPRMFSKQTIRQYAQAQAESTIKIVQATSGKCLSTKNGVTNPAAGTEVVFSSNCSTDASSFVLQADGMLRHKPSNYCVHPSGGTPYSGAQLVVWPSCTAHANLLIDINDDGNIRNTSTGLCVHPSGGSSTPAEGTNALYYSGCSEERLRFTFNRY